MSKKIWPRLLRSNDPKNQQFRIAVFYYPLLLAPGFFLLWWLWRGGSVKESLLFTFGMVLLGSFIGLLNHIVRQKNHLPKSR
jgi:hypothetical protein